MTSFTFTVKEKNGLNAENAGKLIKEILNYSSSIKILKGSKKADARIIFNVLSLNVNQDDTVEFLLDGNKEDEEAVKLEEYLNSDF